MSKSTMRTSIRSVTHSSGTVTDVLTTASARHQRLNVTGGGGTYTIELSTTGFRSGAEFVLDITMEGFALVSSPVVIKSGVGGDTLLTLSALETMRGVVLLALFEGADWVLRPISDGNTIDDIGYWSPAITNAGFQAGVGPEKANFDHTHPHGNRSGGTLHAAATTTTNGFQSAADKKKQDDEGGIVLRVKTEQDLLGAQSFQDMSDGATIDIPVATNTVVGIRVEATGAERRIGFNESSFDTTIASYKTFQGTAVRDGTTTVVVSMTGTWDLNADVDLQMVAVSGGFKLQVQGTDQSGVTGITSAELSVSARVYLYTVARPA